MALLTATAGAGKTRTIAAAAKVWHALTGGRLIGLTLSENAARVMTTEGLPEASNIAQFLGKCRDSDRLRHPVQVGPADKLVIDEAGQVGTADLALIQQAAGPAGLLGVGDPPNSAPWNRPARCSTATGAASRHGQRSRCSRQVLMSWMTC